MKKLLLLILLIAPFFAIAQGRVFNKRGHKLTKEDKKSQKWVEVGSYHDGKVYNHVAFPNMAPEDKLLVIFNGREFFDPKNEKTPILIFENGFLYMGDKADENAIIGCLINNKYYRGKEANSEKLVFSIEGDVPFALLVFANMAK